jgi:dephospho-CoA kinase
MKKIGLTGNIGSGKTLAAQLFRTLGIPVFEADAAGRAVLDDADIVDKLVRFFGKGILSESGNPDRKSLGEIVFADKSALNFLNGLIHPRVMEAWENWLGQQQGVPYVLHEAAILFESGFFRYMDKCIVVSAPRATRLTRVMERDGVSEAHFDLRASRQWNELELISRSDFIIDNSGEQALVPQVLEIHRQLCAFS